MEAFNKENTELIAIDYLKKYDARYNNLVKSECPDFISEKDSIGVEVTVVEFPNFIDSFKYKGKTLCEYIRMKGIKPTQKKEFEDINRLINDGCPLGSEGIINEFIDTFYYKKGDNILKLESVEQYRKLDPSTNLYSKDSFPNETFIENQRIVSFLPSAVWLDQIVDKYVEAVKIKNQKFSHYRKFDENSLLLISFTADLEHSLEFEKIIKEVKGINFDKIFILNVLFGNCIYKIELGKS